MKIPIKFRLKDDDEVHYWELATADYEEVAQLVGYDANGAEVYEGDIVRLEYVDVNGAACIYDYKAYLQGFAQTAKGEYFAAEQFNRLKKI